MKRLTSLLATLCTALVIILVAVLVFQRRLLYYPTHRTETNGLEEWRIDGRLAGYSRTVPHPGAVWLYVHGNAGQAADRTYALPCFSPADAVYILEYPGYGARAGSPCRPAFDDAAREAYLRLRVLYPRLPVGVVGESIGSGPASSLAGLAHPPDKLVLIVPFDSLAAVAGDHFPLVPAGLILFDRWDNVAALRGYAGKVEIFGAVDDRVIPVRHARALAASVPGAVFHAIPGGHNDWSGSGAVRIGI